MAEIIRMPRLSDTMEEGNIVGWLKKVGDKVSPGDILAEVETDKATMELESFHEGYLLYISVKEGPVPVNDILAVIGEKDEDYKSLIESAGNGKEKTDSGKSEKPAPETQEKAEDLEQPKAENEPTDQPKERAGKKSTEEESKSTEKESLGSQPQPETKSPGKEEKKEAPQTDRLKTSPLAKSLAAEAGIDLSTLKGSGDGGRIIKRDVEKYVGEHTQAKASQAPGAQFEDLPLSLMRKTIARRLAESKFSAPHYYLTMRINMDQTSAARKLINETSEVKISINDFVIKACAATLKQHPAVNSSWLGDKLRINKEIHIGVAVAVEDGLLVPVLFNTDKMGLQDINSQVGSLAEKARQKKLQPQEMQGNTFTVSNLGMFGIDEFTAIINPPDSAIMAVGTIADELIMKDGNVSTTKIMKVTLSCDHRVIDGATGAKFLQTFKQYMENPVAMLL